MRDSVVFYRSFYDAIKDLPDDQLVKSFKAIMEYGLNGKEPDTNGLEKTIYLLTKPQIDANNKRYLNGTKGGRKKGENKPGSILEETEPEPKNNQTITKPEPKDKEKVKDKEKDKNTMCVANALFERLWKLYPNKKGKGQVSDAQKKRLLAIGEPTLVKAIERYSLELQKDADWRKPQNGSTFFNSGYEDYLDGNYVPGESKPKVKKNQFAANCPQRDYNMDDLERQLLNR